MLVLLAAGCGGEEPTLPADLATQLSNRSDSAMAQLESGDVCAAREGAEVLQTKAIGAINAGRVPGDLQEELLGHVNALLDAISCTPPEAGGAAEEARALGEWLRERS